MIALTTAVAFQPSIVPSSVTANTLTTLSASNNDRELDNTRPFQEVVTKMAIGCLAAAVLFVSPSPSFADGNTKEFKLPPIDFADKNRCVLSGSKMGQANAARDKLYDLRQCKLSGAEASGLDLSGVIMSGTDVSKAKFVESYFSKGYLRDSNFEGADFTNAIVDRANFAGSSLRGAIFKNAVLSGTSFVDADVEGADFSEAALGDFDIKSLCKNPTLKGENPTTGEDTRFSVGCGPK